MVDVMSDTYKHRYFTFMGSMENAFACGLELGMDSITKSPEFCKTKERMFTV